MPIRQGYLSGEKGRTVRVRTKGTKAFLTIKGPSSGISRTEFEYEIPAEDVNHMLDELCLKPLIEKVRHVEEHNGRIWEIDVFFGENQGLVMAEVELPHENAEVLLPDWVTEEVSHDRRYYNSSLSKNPYTSWK